MKKISNKFKIILICAAIVMSMSSLTAFANPTARMKMATVLSYWETIHVVGVFGTIYEEDVEHQYIDISFPNGYTYTTSSKNITTLGDTLGSIAKRIAYTRTYSTY